MAKFSLEIFYNNQPVESVVEEAEIELRLTNRGDTALENLSLCLGLDKLRTGFTLGKNATLLVPFRVQDLAGQLSFEVRDERETLATVSLEVYPKKITPAELAWIKYERLPRLLAQLDAPNTVVLSYGEEPDTRPYTYTSLDFTAQKLRRYCRLLLEEGLLETLTQRLDYRVIEKPRRDEGVVRGNIRWNPTVQGWLNSPTETGLTHHWVEAPTDYATRPNLLLVFWLKELVYENRKLAWQVETSGQASSQLQKSVDEFKEYAGRFEHFLKTEKNLQPVQAQLVEGFNPRDPALWSEILKDCRGSANPAYDRLVVAFEEYLRRYIRLPEETSEAVGIQPLSVIYEWWAACEMAAAFGLTFQPGEQGRQSGIFRAEKGVLYYNQAAPGGWYSVGRLAPARPDLRFEPADSDCNSRVFLDVKYRAASGDPARAHPEDMYRMLAYMNDFEIATGVIIFPGPASTAPHLRLIERNGGQMRLAELGLRPPSASDPAAVEAWEKMLQIHLTRLQDHLNPA